MAKKVFTVESITADVEAFKAGEFSKTNMSVDWMDNYVAKIEPKTIDKYIKDCMKIPMAKHKIGGVEKEVKDTKAIRKYFIATYFPEYTEEALNAKKEAEKRRKRKKRRQKKHLRR